MFKRVSYRIAMQFTLFVFLLLLVNGSVFLAADFRAVRLQTEAQMVESLQFLLDRARFRPDGVPSILPRTMRETVRIVDADGDVLYAGSVFSEIPFSESRLSHAEVDGEPFVILTAPIVSDDVMTGHIQIAHLDRFHFSEVPERALTYLLVSAGISLLTFFVGLFFARRSLRPAEQMVERLEQFTQDASHELKTPLATLNSSLDLALKSGQYREGILSAKEDVAQVSLLVGRLLELARLDRFLVAREKMDLSALVADAVEKHRPLAEAKSVAIDVSIDPGVAVYGDAALVRQVVTNLLSNAVKFSKPSGGTVRVTLTRQSLVIEDTGIGIPREAQAHIFDRFYQADSSRSQGGYGLGLALVKRIVDLHGWKIRVDSKAGEGTRFVVDMTAK